MGIFGPFKGSPYEWAKILTLQTCSEKSLALPPWGQEVKLLRKMQFRGFKMDKCLFLAVFPIYP